MIKSVHPKPLINVEFVPGRLGRGTIRLGRVNRLDIPGTTMIEGVDDGQSVYEQILEVQRTL